MTLTELVLPEMVDNISGGPRIPTPRLVTHYRQHWRDEPCVYCGRTRRDLKSKKKITKEHIRPLSTCEGRDGRTWENLATACTYCNAERGAMPLLHFLAMKARELTGHRLTKRQRRAMGFVQPSYAKACEQPLDKPQPVCHTHQVKEIPNMSNATPVKGGFIGGNTGHWDKFSLARAQEQHAIAKRLAELDLHAGEN